MALVIALVFMFLSGALFLYGRSVARAISDTGLDTATLNSCLAYEREGDYTFVGTSSTNEVIAYQGKEEIWRASFGGACSAIVIHKDSAQVFVGNQDNKLYVFDLVTGKLKKQIDVGRRIVDLDVNAEGDEVLLATLTGTSKANVMVYNVKGDECFNQKFSVKVSSVVFASDGNMILGNNRGEVQEYDRSGNKIRQYATRFAITQIQKVKDEILVLSKNGQYCILDSNFQALRKAAIDNKVQATPISVGTDANAAYVAVGSSEGYLFILDSDDRQISMTDEGAPITSMATDGTSICFTGNASFVRRIQTDHLSKSAFIGKVETLAILIFGLSVLAAFSFLFLSFERTGQKLLSLAREMWRCRAAYIMLVPSFALVVIFNYYGVFTAFIRAFTNWSAKNSSSAQISFVGFDNFRRMVTEGYFIAGIKNLLLILIFNVLKIMTVPLLMAWLCYEARGHRRKYIHRFLFVLPIVVPGVINAMLWQRIYDPNIGLLNELLTWVGLSNLSRVWLGSADTAIWAIIFMGFPFVNAMAFLVYYGGLIGIGRDVEESAIVDGSNRRILFWRIHVPLLKPRFRVMLMLSLIGSMQNFNEIYILTQGGPGTSTYVPALELYFNVAQFGRYGYACALGVVLFVMTMIVTITNLKLTKSDWRGGRGR